jgi:hypothetical protein
MKLCNFEVAPGHGGAERSGRVGRIRHHHEDCEL